ncbi:hypothetical protein D6J61_26090 [Salmonella enterica subsp. enterica serovar Alachua]|nr:hypothetical protein [Salmonella enterica subsp. enterica serovar Alachua]
MARAAPRFGVRLSETGIDWRRKLNGHFQGVSIKKIEQQIASLEAPSCAQSIRWKTPFGHLELQVKVASA